MPLSQKSGTSTFLFGALFFMAITLLSSCFTGVEGTKKITLSREDRKALEPSEEEIFFSGVTGQPLSEWEKGRQFVAADDKAVLIFDQQGLPNDPSEINLGGKVLFYEGTTSRIAADGTLNTVIIFNDSANVYYYNTGKPLESALQSTTSDQLPMLIDTKMVETARKLLSGKRLWTRSPLWYDEHGDRVPGKKYVPVTVKNVIAGILAFPLKIEFEDSDGNEAWMFMNFGNSGTESRAFPNLFYISDIRKRYSSIDPEVWDIICSCNVRIGMSKEECKLSLGNPTEVTSGHDYSQTLDLWHYPDGTVLWFEDGLLSRFRR